jgi:hypothetical protein
MAGFKNIFSALLFCTAFEEKRQQFRMKNKTRGEKCHACTKNSAI